MRPGRGDGTHRVTAKGISRDNPDVGGREQLGEEEEVSRSDTAQKDENGPVGLPEIFGQNASSFVTLVDSLGTR